MNCLQTQKSIKHQYAKQERDHNNDYTSANLQKSVQVKIVKDNI